MELKIENFTKPLSITPGYFLYKEYCWIKAFSHRSENKYYNP